MCFIISKHLEEMNMKILECPQCHAAMIVNQETLDLQCSIKCCKCQYEDVGYAFVVNDRPHISNEDILKRIGVVEESVRNGIDGRLIDDLIHRLSIKSRMNEQVIVFLINTLLIKDQGVSADEDYDNDLKHLYCRELINQQVTVDQLMNELHDYSQNAIPPSLQPDEVDGLRFEINSMKKELSKLREDNSNMSSDIRAHTRTIEELRKENKNLREQLRYYK